MAPIWVEKSCRFSSFRPVWGPWTARELHVTDELEWFRKDYPRAIDSFDAQTRNGTLLHVTMAFGWFCTDFQVAIDLYDTQTRMGTRPAIDLI